MKTNNFITVSSHKSNIQTMAILVTILVQAHWTEHIFKIGHELDSSNAYMKFGSNQMTNDLNLIFYVFHIDFQQ